MTTANNTKLFFSGQRRVFFLVLAVALLLQAVLFLQSRLSTALNLVSGDFKVAVVLNNATAAEAADFKRTLASLSGVWKVTEINPQKTLDEVSFNTLAHSVSPDFLPRFYELKVNPSILFNARAWVQNNIGALPQDAAAYYKEDQAKLAVYINALARFCNIMLLGAAFAFLAFGFFVEAYYARPVSLRERFGSVTAALFAFALSFVFSYILLNPANKIYPDFAFNLLCIQQCIVLTVCLLAGWTLAKWKRF